MHDVSNVEGEDPVICPVVLDSKSTSCRDFELLLHLQLIHLFKGLERDLELLLLSHPVLEEVSPLLEVQV